MNFRSTLIIILILLLTAGAYFFLFNEPIEEDSDNKKPTITEIYQLPRQNIKKIRLSYSDNSYHPITIQKDVGNVWKLTEPVKAHANKEKVDELLTDFLNKKVKQILDVKEYERYGLSNPTITVELWKEDVSVPKTFFIGKKGANFSVYTKEKSESNIFLIESSALDDMLKSPTDLRDKAVVTFNPNSITEIQFHKPEKLLCKKDGNSWKMFQPLNVNADTNEINYILSKLHSLQVSTFELDGDKAANTIEKYGLDEPIISFSMKSDKESYGLIVGSIVTYTTDEINDDNKHVYVQSVHQGGIYTVSDDILRVLNKSVYDLRDRRVLDFQREDTTKFEIYDDTQKIVGIKLHDDRWELQGTKKMIADPHAVSDLLFGVDSLEAVAFLPKTENNLNSYGLQTPKINVSFSIQGQTKPKILLIGNDVDDNTVYVKTNVSNQVTRVKKEFIDKIAKGEAWLRDKDLFNFNIDDPTQLTLKYTDVSYSCQRLGTNWRLTQPVQEDANNTEVNAILYELIDLQAEEFIGGTFVKQGAKLQDIIDEFRSPQIQITITLRSQKNYTIQIGQQETSGRHYSRLLQEPKTIFLVKAELISKLKTELELLRAQEIN